MHVVRTALVALTLFAVGCGDSVTTAPQTDPADASPARPAPKPGSIEAFVKDKERLPGFFDVIIDRDAAKIWLELPAADDDGLVAELLYVEGLAHGLGSNPVGLDRGKIGSTRVVRFERIGRKLFVVQPNLAFRATTDNADERRAVEQAFARSILWSGNVVAEAKDGRFIVDFTGFVVRDAFGVVETLRASEQGTFKLDAKRSTLDPRAVLAFPDNLEFEALLTFGSTKPGPEVRRVTPTPEAVTLVQHHSLVRLPDDDYEPRRFDPRSGALAIEFADYAAPLDEPIEKRWIVRHRLQKKDPTAARSAPVEPIVYYVDRGAPEPVRQALIEGASWWNQAFEAAGYVDAFQVKLLPADAHPLDVRYNVIQWVHRQTRGWSYGGGVVDPRTGERIKGHVSLGSLRVRQDRRIFEGMLGATNSGTGTADDPVQLALARIRQLSAHEVGHTIGFAHNFSASTWGGRASVMDYPAMWIRPAEDGTLDVSSVYDVGIGAWDETTVQYAYGDFPAGTDEDAALDAILRESALRGEEFISDGDARPVGGAHPTAHLWDNGRDAAASLREVLEVRRIALENFDLDNLPTGEPIGLLQQTFVPVYLYHRFQMEAAVKLIGGLDYAYAVGENGSAFARVVDEERQRDALDALLECIQPATLDIPDSTLALLAPRPYGYQGANRELMKSSSAPAFDALGAASTAADATLRLILAGPRCARLVDQERRMQTDFGLDEVLDALLESAFDRRAETERERAIQREVQRVLVDRMIERAFDDATPNAVRVVIEDRLARLQNRLVRRGGGEGIDAAHDTILARDLDRFLYQREWNEPTGWRPEALPPGSPIGCGY